MPPITSNAIDDLVVMARLNDRHEILVSYDAYKQLWERQASPCESAMNRHDAIVWDGIRFFWCGSRKWKKKRTTLSVVFVERS